LKKSTLIIFFVIIYSSCNSKQDNFLLENSKQSLETSNKFIKSSTNDLYKSLKNKAEDIQTKEIADKWLYQLNGLNDSTISIIQELDNLKKSTENKVESKFVGKHLENYINFLETLETEIKLNYLVDSSLIETGNFNMEKLLNQSTSNEMAVNIEILKNSIFLTENKIVEFANNKSMLGCILTFEKFGTLIGQNALHFRHGDELIISGGVGSYSIASSPTFIIDKNSILKPDENGVVTFKKKVIDKPGKYQIPVVVRYISPDGEMKTKETNLEYEVH
jgi:hypothetical protein